MAANRKPAEPSSYSPLDRAPLPDVVEHNSDSAWAKFEALQRGEVLAPTQPAPLPTGFGTGSYDTTQPLEPGPRAGATGQAPLAARDASPPRQRALTLADVLAIARTRNRACPLPDAWVAFHQLLPTRELHGRVLGAPLPMTGPAWASATAMEKRMRLRDQIEWAERTGALGVAYDFLAAVPEEGWFHFSD